MKKDKWNYAVVRSIFGDYWVGRTTLKPKKEIIFSNRQEAIEKAKYLFREDHPEFDPDLCSDDDNDMDELLCEYEQIGTGDEIIDKGLEKFIVGNY
jgi:hypothetical protein